MIINCPICSDYFLPTSCLAGCPCGHVFHFECLLQWLERSKTCPQCRKPTTDSKTFKVYLNITENLSQEDPACLSHEIDGLKLKLRNKESELKRTLSFEVKIQKELADSKAESQYYKEKCEALESQVSAYRKHARKQKTLEDDIKLLRQQKDIADAKIKTLESLQVVLDGNLDDAETTLISHSDNSETSKTMIVFCSALKKHTNTLQGRLNRSKREQEHYKQLFTKETQLKGKVEEELKSLKEKSMHDEREIQSLRNKLQKIESSLGPLDNEQVKDQMLLRLLHESPMPEKYRNLRVQVVSPEVISISSSVSFTEEPTESMQPIPQIAKPKNVLLVKKNSTLQPRLPLSTKQAQDKPSCSTFRLLPSTSATGAIKKTASANLGKIGKSKSDGNLGVARPTSSSLFGQTRISRMASGGSLQKRLHDACRNPPEGMVYNGMGGTVRAEQPIPFKKKMIN